MKRGDRIIDHYRFTIGLLLFLMSYPLSESAPSVSEDGGIANHRSAVKPIGQNKTRTRYNASTADAAALPHRLIEGSVEVILLNVSDSRWHSNDGLEAKLNHFVIERYVVTSRNPRVAKILNSSLVSATAPDETEVLHDSAQSHSPKWDEELYEDIGVSALSVKISGRRVGKTVVDVSVYGFATDRDNGTAHSSKRSLSFSNSSEIQNGELQPNKEMRLIISFDVCVLRRSLYHRLSFAFTIFVAIITVATTFLIGTQLDWKIVIKELKKPASLLVGVGFEFILMPLVSRDLVRSLWMVVVVP